MKTKLLAIAALALALTGCATNDYVQYAKAQEAIAVAKGNADAARYKAMSDIAASGDSSAKVAAVMAMALGQASSGAQATIQAPQASTALQWASVLVPGLTQIAGMGFNARSQIVQSNNAAAVAQSTNGAFVGIAGQIQAPAANITTSTTDRHDSVVSPVPVLITPTAAALLKHE